MATLPVNVDRQIKVLTGSDDVPADVESQNLRHQAVSPLLQLPRLICVIVLFSSLGTIEL
jgi:hypothetical protein